MTNGALQSSQLSRRSFSLAAGAMGVSFAMRSRASTIRRWEFGERDWCQFSADTALRLLSAAGLDLESLEWGMSERYDQTPARLSDGRDVVGFHVMITGGKIVGGSGVTAACLALDGMHSRCPWGLIAGAAAVPYGQAGQMRRRADEAVLMTAIKAATGRDVLTPVKPTVCPVVILQALTGDLESGGGLHNLTAARTAPSIELTGLPFTRMGVPIFGDMSAEQQSAYLRLLGL